MQIIPVLDILHGVVVRGIAGRRDEYQPLVSRLTTSTDPVSVACALRETLGLNQLYVADLDGILRQQPHREIYQRLLQSGFQLMVDPGIRTASEVGQLLDAGLTHVIVGLESCRSPDELRRLAAQPIEISFSLDLQQGIPRVCEPSTGWSSDPLEIVDQAIQAGALTILPLDLADVGMGTGGSTDAICRKIRDSHPEAKIIAGGGVRSREDLVRWNQLGVDGVLIASAFHDGRLNRADLFTPYFQSPAQRFFDTPVSSSDDGL